VALGFVGFKKGGITLRKTGERAVLDRRATTFWATDKLVKLAEHFGVPLENIGAHFKPERPSHHTIRLCCAPQVLERASAENVARSSRGTSARRLQRGLKRKFVN